MSPSPKGKKSKLQRMSLPLFAPVGMREPSASARRADLSISEGWSESERDINSDSL